MYKRWLTSTSIIFFALALVPMWNSMSCGSWECWPYYGSVWDALGSLSLPEYLDIIGGAKSLVIDIIIAGGASVLFGGVYAYVIQKYHIYSSQYPTFSALKYAVSVGISVSTLGELLFNFNISDMLFILVTVIAYHLLMRNELVRASKKFKLWSAVFFLIYQLVHIDSLIPPPYLPTSDIFVDVILLCMNMTTFVLLTIFLPRLLRKTLLSGT